MVRCLNPNENPPGWGNTHLGRYLVCGVVLIKALTALNSLCYRLGLQHATALSTIRHVEGGTQREKRS